MDPDGIRDSADNVALLPRRRLDSEPAGRKSSRKGILKIRTMAAIVATILVAMSLLVDENLTNQMMPYLYDDSTTIHVERVPDLQIYPRDFQILYEKRKRQLDFDRRSNDMHSEFERRNRESIYALFLVDKNATAEENAKNNAYKDNIMIWGINFDYLREYLRKRHKQGIFDFHDITGRSFTNETERWAHKNDPKTLKAAYDRSQKPRIIEEENLCSAYKNAKATNFSTPHVLITHLNENWGVLSTQVPNRTVQWGNIINIMEKYKGFHCDPSSLKEEYLDSPNTLAVFSTQFQSIFDHPKVHSIPIGVARSDGFREKYRAIAKQQQNWLHDPKPRQKLLMINNNPSGDRLPQVNAVIRNFEKLGVLVDNTYKSRSGLPYMEELSTSKFILSPSGMGYDCYRIWEALMMGAIPIIERKRFRFQTINFPPESGQRNRIIRSLEHDHERGNNLDATQARPLNGTLGEVEYLDGWRRTLDDLPVLWIDGSFTDIVPENYTYNKDSDTNDYLTPDLLNHKYDQLAAKMETFKYEKLTMMYWLRFMESFVLLQDPTTAHDSIDGPTRFSSVEEQKLWQVAMDTLTPTFHNHSMISKRPGAKDGEGWKNWKVRDVPATESNVNKTIESPWFCRGGDAGFDELDKMGPDFKRKAKEYCEQFANRR